jgi:hypothetical protein
MADEVKPVPQAPATAPTQEAKPMTPETTDVLLFLKTLHQPSLWLTSVKTSNGFLTSKSLET